MGQLTEAWQIDPRASVAKAAAVRAGSRHYYTGKPCKRGHYAFRFVSDGACVECKDVALNKYRTSNREQLRVRDRTKYAADPVKFRARTKAYLQRPEGKAAKQAWEASHLGYHRAWYAENVDDQRAKMRARRAAKPDLYRSHGRNRRARVREAEGCHTGEDIAKIRLNQKDRCGYCRAKLFGNGHVDHIVPLVLGGSNWPKNLQLLCVPCNLSKNASDPIDFAQSLGRLI